MALQLNNWVFLFALVIGSLTQAMEADQNKKQNSDYQDELDYWRVEQMPENKLPSLKFLMALRSYEAITCNLIVSESMPPHLKLEQVPGELKLFINELAKFEKLLIRLMLPTYQIAGDKVTASTNALINYRKLRKKFFPYLDDTYHEGHKFLLFLRELDKHAYCPAEKNAVVSCLMGIKIPQSADAVFLTEMLHKAIRNGDNHLVAFLAVNGAYLKKWNYPGRQDGKHHIPLQTAIAMGNVHACEILINGYLCSIKQQQPEIQKEKIMYLLHAPVRTNDDWSDENESLLSMVLLSGQLDILKIFLETAQKCHLDLCEFMNRQIPDGRTPLLIGLADQQSATLDWLGYKGEVSSAKQIETIQYFLDIARKHSIDVNKFLSATCPEGRRLFCVPSRAMVHFLCDHAQHYDIRTQVLIIALGGRDLARVAHLLNEDAGGIIELLVFAEKNGITLTHMVEGAARAISRGCFDWLDFLISKGFNFDLKCLINSWQNEIGESLPVYLAGLSYEKFCLYRTFCKKHDIAIADQIKCMQKAVVSCNFEIALDLAPIKEDALAFLADILHKRDDNNNTRLLALIKDSNESCYIKKLVRFAHCYQIDLPELPEAIALTKSLGDEKLELFLKEFQ